MNHRVWPSNVRHCTAAASDYYQSTRQPRRTLHWFRGFCDGRYCELVGFRKAIVQHGLSRVHPLYFPVEAFSTKHDCCSLCRTSPEIQRVVLTVLNSSSRQSSLVSTNVTIALEVFLNDMRYINPRFTYLLTYLGLPVRARGRVPTDRCIDKLIYIAPINSKEPIGASVAK